MVNTRVWKRVEVEDLKQLGKPHLQCILLRVPLEGQQKVHTPARNHELVRVYRRVLEETQVFVEAIFGAV
ncbi:unnamed protein product [Rodentolepis nana]|uniref:Transposase n=1 Tax=Rodentolepis nana TaxID=102285 RepID=A0A0R3TWB3_RODNA|nr:unnamed protein product [Rodentolepis nana]